MMKRIFTSESVTEGHPDKVCDQISDGVMDAILSKDPNARVACECAATTGMVLVMGEISTNCYVDIPKVARETLKKIGYDSPEAGFNGNTCAVLTAIDDQSADIAMGVDSSYDEADTTGAGDVFHGGFISAWLRGLDAVGSARWASAVSYIKCTRLGGRAGIPTRDMVDHFLCEGTLIHGDELDARSAFYRDLVN